MARNDTELLGTREMKMNMAQEQQRDERETLLNCNRGKKKNVSFTGKRRRDSINRPGPLGLASRLRVVMAL